MPKPRGAATADAQDPAAPARTVTTPFVDGLNGAAIGDVDIADERLQFRVTTRADDLCAATTRDGQLEPTELRGMTPSRFTNGFRRLRAIKDLGWPVVKAMVHRDIAATNAHERAFVKDVIWKHLSALDRKNRFVSRRSADPNAPRSQPLSGSPRSKSCDTRRSSRRRRFIELRRRLMERATIDSIIQDLLIAHRLLKRQPRM